MSIASTSCERTPHDLSHLIFSCGKLGRLQTLSSVPVIAGDSYEENLVGSIRLSPLRRGLVVDSTVDVFSFYVPHRHIYGNEWIDFMKEGMSSDPLTQTDIAFLAGNTGRFGMSGGSQIQGGAYTLPHFVPEGYDKIYNNYFKVPYDDDRTYVNESTITEDGRYGYLCANLKSIWTTPLPPNSENFADFGAPVAADVATINIMDLNRQYAELHTEQERDFFMQRYRDVMFDGFGGAASIDADDRPQLLKRTTFHASGYDVDGTAQETLGQYSGRVQQSFKHQVPRFFVPEHGVIWTVALVRFPVTHHSENHYLYSAGVKDITYEDIAGDPAIVGNSPPATVNGRSIFGELSNDYDFEVPHSQWYRYQPDVVHGDYQDVQGFPFLTDFPASVDDALYVQPDAYDEMFQTEQLGQWQVQARKNVNVIRRLPTSRDAILTNN